MTFRAFVSEVRSAVESAMTAASMPSVEFDVSEPPRKEFGDLTCNVAFQLGKKMKMPPPKIAATLINHIRPPPADSYILRAEVHAAGYLNFHANYVSLASQTLSSLLENPDGYGRYDVGKGRHFVIEHTSVNPNKALHVGHMRNVIIGDALARIMRAANFSTTVLNYIDDSGLQVADILVGFRFAGFSAVPPNGQKFDHYCGDEVYVKVNQMYEKDPALAEKRKLVLKEIEEGTSELARFASEITTRVLKDQLVTCWRMKARYDLLNFESQIVHSKLWQQSFELLKQKKIVRLEKEGKNAGCWVISAQGEEDKVVVRSDGTATYVAKDIPYAAWKLGLVNDPFHYREFATQWDGSVLYATSLSQENSAREKFSGGDRVITIIDSRQARLQRIISQVLEQMGTHGREYIHLAYEAVTLSAETAKSFGMEIGGRQSVHMSGRKGIYVNADYVLDTLHSKAYEEVKSRNPEFDPARLHEIAEQVAVSAIRYSLAKQDLDKAITFDITESLSLEGDTGPYLQYAYARAQRILEKAGINVSNTGYEKLNLEPETALIKEVAKLDMVLEDAASSLAIKSLARYSYSLATLFNVFYEKVPVLREPDKDAMAARLALVKAFGIALRNSLDLLGISALDRM